MSESRHEQVDLGILGATLLGLAVAAGHAGCSSSGDDAGKNSGSTDASTTVSSTGGSAGSGAGGTATTGAGGSTATVSGGGSTTTSAGGSSTTGAGGSGLTGSGGSSTGSGGSSTGSGGSSTGSGGSASGAGGSVGAGGSTDSTDPNLKVAFIGDTTSDSSYTQVLNLIKSEGAQGIVVEGDMSYSADPAAWWSATEAALGSSFPIFLSRGNHDDSSWPGYLPKAQNHLDGAVREAGAHDANYKTTWRGLVIATIRKGDSGSNIAPFFENDKHIWKICNWHQNQQAMQVGGKSDEMGWDVYETCRQHGAIIQTGHEHSYERTKTLTNIAGQVVDSSCSAASALCVGPGRTFVNVVGLGGNDVRAQTRCLPATPPYGCNGEWAFIYTSNQQAKLGAQFITFNAGGPSKATGYFKNVDGDTVDTFTITRDP